MFGLWDILLVPLVLLYANAIEWAAHKYVLHGLGKKKSSMWSFHWHEHHKTCRRYGNLDMAYGWSPNSKKKWWGWRSTSVSKERVGLLLLLALHIPVAPYSPIVFLTLAYATFNYYYVHKKSHLDVEWAKKHLPWHYDHHMGKDQDANWCITRPWFDKIMGTRVVYTYYYDRSSKNGR